MRLWFFSYGRWELGLLVINEYVTLEGIEAVEPIQEVEAVKPLIIINDSDNLLIQLTHL